MAVVSVGPLVIADALGRMVRLASGWTVSLVASPPTGTADAKRDDGQASEATVDPSRVTVGMAGAPCIDDVPRQRVIGPDSISRTATGGDQRGDTGPCGPALEATCLDPVHLAFDEEGNLYVSDHLIGIVRKVDPCGIMTTVPANDANAEGAADGYGPVIEEAPKSRAITAHGRFLYIEDMADGRVRAVEL